MSGSGVSISAKAREVYDFDRLERAVSALAAALADQRKINAGLQERLDENAQRVRTLEGKLLGANQKRQDVAKRVEELIAQLDHLDGEIHGAEL